MKVGDIVLIKEEEDYNKEILECEIIEIAPSGTFIKVKITDDHRIHKRWYNINQILENLNE